MNKIISLDLVIPCYNEEERLQENINKFISFKNNFCNFNLIFVNDGSTDLTLTILKKYKQKYDFIKIISYKNNLGKGYAIRNGILNSKNDYILVTDVDLSTPLSEFKKLEKYSKDFDIIIGSRALKKSLVKTKQNIIKIILGRFGNILIKNLLNLNIKDTQCGFKLFNSKIKNIFNQSKINGFGYDFEILFISNLNKLKIKEVAIIWINDNRSKVRYYHYILTILELLKIKLNYFNGKYK